MADISMPPLQNYGALLSSFGAGLANQENASTNQLGAEAAVPGQLANAGLLGAQAQGAGLANQLTAMKLNAYQNYFNAQNQPPQGTVTPGALENPDGSGVSNSASPNAPPGTPFDPAAEAASMDQKASDQFRVFQGFTPQEQARYNAAAELAMITGNQVPVQIAQAQQAQRVAAQTKASQNAAQPAFDQAYALATAPKGVAYTMFERSNPQAATALATRMGLDPDHPEDWTPAEQQAIDSHIKQYSAMTNQALFQYTGDGFIEKNGITLNSRTGLPPIGIQAQGIPPQEWAKLATEGSKPIPVPRSDGTTVTVPTWQAPGSGARSLAQWVTDRASMGQNALPGASSPGAGGAAPSAGGAAPSAGGAAPALPPQLANDPVMSKALSDPQFKIQAPPVTTGVSQSPMALAQQQALVKSRTDLTNSAQALTDSSAQALQYIRAAQQVLAAKGAPVTGLYAPAAAMISRVFPGGLDAAHYQEVAKYLGNLAVQSFKQNFGSHPASAEFDVQMHSLSAAAPMQPEAIADLLNTNARIAQYGIASAARVGPYLRYNGDPQQYAQWNQQYFPRQRAVVPGRGAPAAAVAALKANPALAPQFKAKYGYLPQGDQ